MQVRQKTEKLYRKPFHKCRYKDFKTLNLGDNGSDFKNIKTFLEEISRACRLTSIEQKIER